MQIAEERKEAKSKGERERYSQLNTESQRIARRDKKAFLNEQCKEIEENNKMGKTSHLLKNFPQFPVIQTAKDFSIANEREVDVF